MSSRCSLRKGFSKGTRSAIFYSLSDYSGVLNARECDFVVGYLDDFTLGGSVQSLIAQFHAIDSGACALGLELNRLKCEIIGLSDLTQAFWQSSLPGIPEVIFAEASLLGAPLRDERVQQVLME